MGHYITNKYWQQLQEKYNDDSVNDPKRIKGNVNNIVQKAVTDNEKRAQNSRLAKLKKRLGGTLPPSKKTGTRTTVIPTDYGGSVSRRPEGRSPPQIREPKPERTSLLKRLFGRS